jgi:hypothetical protein
MLWALAARAAPAVDGRPDESAWSEAIVVDKLRQIVPTRGEQPTVTTQVRLLYDDRNLHVAIKSRHPVFLLVFVIYPLPFLARSALDICVGSAIDGCPCSRCSY